MNKTGKNELQNSFQTETIPAEAAQVQPHANRIYKARIFEMLFSDKKELLGLYNATGKTNYTDPELLEINTLENAIYMAMHNDISFIIDSRLSLYEHQSTYSPNLPLRYLMYIADLYSVLTRKENLYGHKAVMIPVPFFVIFYNGEEQLPDRVLLPLSDLFKTPKSFLNNKEYKELYPALELKALLLNINPGHNQELMNSCKTLKDYSEYTARVRQYAKVMNLEDAVERAITECIAEGILSDFLEKNRAEAKSVSIYEYDQERHLRQEREEAREEGEKIGREAGIRAFVIDHIEEGMPPEKSILKLQKLFSLTNEEAKSYYEEYSQTNC